MPSCQYTKKFLNSQNSVLVHMISNTSFPCLVVGSLFFLSLRAERGNLGGGVFLEVAEPVQSVNEESHLRDCFVACAPRNDRRGGNGVT